MHFGGAMFFTDYSMSAPELARALEERGFESVWAPEHSHIPLSRKTPFPGGGDLPKQYYDALDPFVVLSAAAPATRTTKRGTGVLRTRRSPAEIPRHGEGGGPRSGVPRDYLVRPRRGCRPGEAPGRDGRRPRRPDVPAREGRHGPADDRPVDKHHAAGEPVNRFGSKIDLKETG